MPPHPAQYEARPPANCRSGLSGAQSVHGGPCSPRNNDIPIVRYWAQTLHCRSPGSCCEPVGMRSNAKRAWGAGCQVRMGILKNATVPGPRPTQQSASHGLWDCARGGRELVPRRMQPHHADGQFWPAAIVASLTMAYCTRLRLAHLYPMYMYGRILGPAPPAEFFQSARDVTFWPPCSVLVFSSPRFCQRLQLAWHARALSFSWGRLSAGSVLCFVSSPFGLASSDKIR